MSPCHYARGSKFKSRTHSRHFIKCDFKSTPLPFWRPITIVRALSNYSATEVATCCLQCYSTVTCNKEYHYPGLATPHQHSSDPDLGSWRYERAPVPRQHHSVMSPSLSLLLFAVLLNTANSKNTLDYLEAQNIKGEQHRVVTDDGYILNIFRIPNRGSTPVLVMHGFMGTSDMWLLMEREYNIVNILADNGYDVWLSNQRGNVNSHEHQYLSTEPSSYSYWDFSCDEVALRDLPPTIDHILATTGRQKLLYMGHSMGSTVYLILCAKLPEYCNKIDTAALLAPVAYAPKSVTVPSVRLLVEWSHIIAESLRKAHVYEFLGRKQFLVDFTYQSCLMEGLFCTITMQALDFRTENKTLIYPIAEYLHAVLGGTSLKVYEHLTTMLSKNGYFGPLKTQNNGFNNILANPSVVEEYKYEINSPVALFWASDDLFIDETAIDKLLPKLKNVVLHQVIPAPFKHMGFFYEIKSNYGVVKNILNVFSKYDSSKKRFRFRH